MIQEVAITADDGASATFARQRHEVVIVGIAEQGFDISRVFPSDGCFLHVGDDFGQVVGVEALLGTAV